MSKKYIIALDQGTTSTRAILFNNKTEIIGISRKTFQQIYPKPGWVEHNADEIWETAEFVIRDLLGEVKVTANEISAIGITNQRETTIVWDKRTGKPIYNAIVWQSRQTEDICKALRTEEYEKLVKEKTGLVIDPYFSASKVKWILDNIEGARQKAESGNLMFGTIDTWLLYKLTGKQAHKTDYSNAARTMLFNINTLIWDKELLSIFDIPETILPEVCPSSDIYGKTKLFGEEIIISGIAGDQQAALFGQTCFEAGSLKNTYGTGCFLLQNTGKKPIFSKKGLLTTIAWGLNGEVIYCLEGSVFMAGAAIEWLKEGLKILPDVSKASEIAFSLNSNEGVFLVPAFQGLGSPYWSSESRAMIFGMTRSTTNAHIVRATLESIAFRTKDIVQVMEEESSEKITYLRVDGGATKNNFLMQFQADILGITVESSKVNETTALGAAMLAGLKSGFWKNLSELKNISRVDKVYNPELNEVSREKIYSDWKRLVATCIANYSHE